MGDWERWYLRPGPEEEDHTMETEYISQHSRSFCSLSQPLGRRTVGLHESMRSTDFGTVDGAIASGFKNC